MEIKEYQQRVKEIMDKLDSIIKTPSEHVTHTGFIDIKDIVREFRHLVYSFDSHLPLNNELDDTNYTVLYQDTENKLQEIRKQIKFFLKYINDYSSETGYPNL